MANYSYINSGSGIIETSNKATPLYDVSVLKYNGIDPKTGAPLKMVSGTKRADQPDLKREMKKILRDKDLVTAVRRYKWDNLPKGINEEFMERLLYYRGQGCLFYSKEFEKYFFLPYALVGSVDCYGRYNKVTPLPWGGQKVKEGEKEKPWIPGLELIPIYDPNEIPETGDREDYCVLIQDRCPQYNSATIISRQIINDPLLDVMAECIPFMRTALIAGTGVKGMRVEDLNQEDNVRTAANSIVSCALEGKMYVPITAPVELQELTGGALSKAEDYMSAFQSLENFRLSTYGLENAGVFQKKAHMLQDEQNMNGGNNNLILDDGLARREYAAEIFNKIFGENIVVSVREQMMNEIAEPVTEEGGNDGNENNSDTQV